jgi:hypothetical protein
MSFLPPRLVLVVSCALAASAFAQAGDSPPPPLSPELMAGAKVLVPSPSELIHSLKSANVAKWNDSLADVTEAGSPHRFDAADEPVKALNLGIRVANCFVAIAAQERGAFDDSAVLVKTLAKQLGASERITTSGENVEKLVIRGDWAGMRVELDAMRGELLRELETVDRNAATLATVGGWLQGLHLVTGVLTRDYSEASSKILRQPDLAAHLRTSIEELGASVKGHARVREVIERLKEIEPLLAVEREGPVPRENVQQVRAICAAVIQGLER